MRTTSFLQLLCVLVLFAGEAPKVFAQYDNDSPPIRTFEDSRRQLNINPFFEETDGEAARFARWEYRMTPRLLKGGVFPKPTILLDELQKYNARQAKSKNNAAPLATESNWKPLGPYAFDEPAYNGAKGRINVIRFHPNDTTILFVGTPDGGLWKTTDEGITWKPLTDNIPSLGVTDIAIDPKHPDTIYIATGDARAAAMYGNPYSYGVLKTTDGGATWKPTGIEMDMSEKALTQRVVVSPINSDIVFAGVYGGNNRGIHKSTDGGKTFAVKDGGSIFDIQFNPADPTLMYASGYGNFRRSTNSGETWSGIGGLPTSVDSGVTRTLIGVTPADANVVYVLYVHRTANSIHALYRSSDKGLTFIKMFDKTKAPSVGTGGEYNLVLSVSSTDANVIITGQQRLARSTNGGATWTNIANGLHWDNHAFIFTPNSGEVCYSGNDGGMYRSEDIGNTWTDLSDDLQITQYYRMGGAAQRGSLLYSGAQDNGIHRKDGDFWQHAMSGADGMECAIDYSDENIAYVESQNGAIFRTTDGGKFFTGIRPPGAGNGHWITPIYIHPTKPERIYTAYKRMYGSINRGTTWDTLSPELVPGDNIKHFAVAEINDQVIYAGTYIKLFKTTNGGKNWTDIGAGTPIWDTAALFSIMVSPTNSNHVWITFAGFADGHHVFNSTNGGTTWKNITGTLANVNANSLVYEKSSNDGIYLGTDLGVFYRDKTMNDWEPYMTGLPNVSVSELEIHEASGMIRAATFGRGIWESPMKSLVAPTKPILRLPNNGWVGQPLLPEFTWRKLLRTSSYMIEVARDTLFANIVWSRNSIADTSYASITTLETGTKYFWRIKAENAVGESPYSEVWSFTTQGVSSTGFQPVTSREALRVSYGIDRKYANIEFDLAKQTICLLKLYSITGEEIQTIASGTYPPGTQRVKLRTEHLATGVYYVQLIANGEVKAAKCVVW